MKRLILGLGILLRLENIKRLSKVLDSLGAGKSFHPMSS